MHLCTRSFRSRETSPAAKLESLRVGRSTLPDQLDARSSLQLQDNLGHRKGGVTCRVGRHSRGSLHRASFRAQKQDVSFSDHRTAPSSTKSLPESTPLWQLATEEGTGQTNLSESNLPLRQALEAGTRHRIQEQVPPPTQLWHFMLQLTNEVAKLHQVVGKFAVLLDSQPVEKPQLGCRACKREG